eukprot:scaffold1790_cov130-Isochrysis_galbana.AAC.8
MARAAGRHKGWQPRQQGAQRLLSDEGVQRAVVGLEDVENGFGPQAGAHRLEDGRAKLVQSFVLDHAGDHAAEESRRQTAVEPVAAQKGEDVADALGLDRRRLREHGRVEQRDRPVRHAQARQVTEELLGLGARRARTRLGLGAPAEGRDEEVERGRGGAREPSHERPVEERATRTQVGPAGQTVSARAARLSSQLGR